MGSYGNAALFGLGLGLTGLAFGALAMNNRRYHSFPPMPFMNFTPRFMPPPPPPLAFGGFGMGFGFGFNNFNFGFNNFNQGCCCCYC